MTWTYVETENDAGPGRLIRYAVHDALGMRLGHVRGWVLDPDGSIQMLNIAVTEWNGASEYLVPTGAVTLISDTKGLIQLRDVTKQSIGRVCIRYRGELPEPRLLVSLMRHFRAPRISVVERLAVGLTMQSGGPAWERLSEMEPAPKYER